MSKGPSTKYFKDLPWLEGCPEKMASLKSSQDDFWEFHSTCKHWQGKPFHFPNEYLEQRSHFVHLQKWPPSEPLKEGETEQIFKWHQRHQPPLLATFITTIDVNKNTRSHIGAVHSHNFKRNSVVWLFERIIFLEVIMEFCRLGFFFFFFEGWGVFYLFLVT